MQRLTGALMMLLMASCGTPFGDDVIIIDGPSSSYLPLAVGNWWTYDRISRRADGSIETEATDSTYVSRDTLVDDDLFYELVGQFAIDQEASQGVWLRDSAGFIIELGGRVYFDPVALPGAVIRTDSFELDLYAEYSRQEDTVSIQVPFGDFVTTLVNGEVYSLTDPSYIRLHQTYFAQGFGVVYEELPFALSDSVKIERSLRAASIQH